MLPWVVGVSFSSFLREKDSKFLPRRAKAKPDCGGGNGIGAPVHQTAVYARAIFESVPETREQG